MISDVFIKRPKTAIVISVILLALGVIAILTLPVSQYPDISPPSVSISSSFVGADAQTVEQTVTTPIETQVNGSPGMDYITSSSSNDGTSLIQVHYKIGTDPDIATLDVQNRVGIATPQLPDLVKRLGITTRKRNSSILMIVALYSPTGEHGMPFLDNYTNVFVHDALLRVYGVGDIFARQSDFSMRIWLQPDKLSRLGMTPAEVVAALTEQNLEVGVGTVGAPPQPGGQAFEYSVFTNSRLSTPEEFGQVIVRSDPAEGALVYLRDVARVELGEFSYGGTPLVDGKPGSFLMIYQSPGSNALSVYDGVIAELENLKKSFPAGVDYIVPYESVSVVKTSIEEVIKTLLVALLLVTLVVFVFLQNWRATLIPILAIPVAIVATFAVFIPLGFTINTLTMFGFVLSIGIVVDDAIIVVEATQRHIDSEKLSAKEAVRKAMADISGPVVAIALVLAAVFVPVGFMPGIVGRLYQQFAITIAVSVVISAFVALSLTPALCSVLLKPLDDKPPHGIRKLFARFNAWFDRVTASYTGGVGRAIKYKRLVIVLLVCITAGAVVLFERKPTGFIPDEDEGRIFVAYQLAEGASTARSQQAIEQISAIINKTDGILHNAAMSGFNVISGGMKASSGTLFLQMTPWKERRSKSLHMESIIARLRSELAAVEGANTVVMAPPAISGMGATAGFSVQLQQRGTADDMAAFERVAAQFVAEAAQRPEITAPFTFFSARTPGYQLDLDREKCKRMGVSVSDVFTTLQTYVGSAYVNDFTLYGRSYRVVAQADTAYRSTVDELSKYYVSNSAGQMVPLSTLIEVRPTQNASTVSHFNIFRSVEIDGSASPGYSSGDAIQAVREVADKVLPAGYGYEFSGMSREELNSSGSMLLFLAISLGFVFLFLVALYESWSVPLSVILAVPIGVFGAILTLTCLPSISNNVYAQIGLIALIGLAAKNAILIVEYAKERTDAGMEAVKATLQAVSLRLRPIVMTSLAFCLGVLPLAFATGAGAAARVTIGWTVLGGMVAASSLAIFIVPVLFVVIMKVSGRKSAKRG